MCIRDSLSAELKHQAPCYSPIYIMEVLYFLFCFVSFLFILLLVFLGCTYVCTMDMFLALFPWKRYGMICHSSLVPCPCVPVLRCTYHFVWFLPSREALFVGCVVTTGWFQENDILLSENMMIIIIYELVPARCITFHLRTPKKWIRWVTRHYTNYCESSIIIIVISLLYGTVQ